MPGKNSGKVTFLTIFISHSASSMPPHTHIHKERQKQRETGKLFLFPTIPKLQADPHQDITTTMIFHSTSFLLSRL